MENIDNLSKYGHTFQVKAISCMLTDKSFLDQALDIVDERHFESDAHRWIVERILWYFGTYQGIPSMEVFKTELEKVKDTGSLRTGIIVSLKEVYRNISSSDIDYIKAEYLAFCKNQALKNAIISAADMLPYGDYDGIKSVIDKALQSGQERNYGHNWKDDLEDRFSSVSRPTIPTPWSVLNERLDGGLGPGELGVIVAPPGIGKTWALCAVGNHAVAQGYNVIQYTLELNEGYVGLRHDTITTGINPNEIKNNKDVVKESLSELKGNLLIKSYPPRACNTNILRAHINRIQMMRFKPDLIVIDYADLMRSTAKSESRYQDLGMVYEDLRALGSEIGCPIWTASQSNRSSMNEEIIGADEIAESFSKIMGADFVMSISRKLEDKQGDTGRVYTIKNRFGIDGEVFPAQIDFMKGVFSIHHPDSNTGQKLNSKMSTKNDVLRKLMKGNKLETD